MAASSFFDADVNDQKLIDRLPETAMEVGGGDGQGRGEAVRDACLFIQMFMNNPGWSIRNCVTVHCYLTRDC